MAGVRKGFRMVAAAHRTATRASDKTFDKLDSKTFTRTFEGASTLTLA